MSIYNLSGDSIDTVFGVAGDELQTAYNLSGEIITGDPGEKIVVRPDEATGTPTQYTFYTQNTAEPYILYDVINNMIVDSNNLQAFCYDSDRNVFYKFDSSTTVIVYNSAFQKTGVITLPETAGHNNDAYYLDGVVYMPDSEHGIYKWDVASNTVSHVGVIGIIDPSNDILRSLSGLSDCGISGKFYLTCIDYTGSGLVHNPDDKLSVYLYDIATNTATLQAEFPWDCVYLQGSAFYDGILYATCNTQTTESAGNYKGITLKAFRTDTWEQLNSLIANGDIEPESLNVYPYSNTPEFMMGVAKYGQMTKVARFTIPYELI